MRALVTTPQNTVARAGVAQHAHRSQEHDAADGAGAPLEEEVDEVHDHEDGVVGQEGRVYWLRYEQHWKQPLQAIHDLKRNLWLIKTIVVDC